MTTLKRFIGLLREGQCIATKTPHLQAKRDYHAPKFVPTRVSKSLAVKRKHAFNPAGRYKHQEAYIPARHSKVVPHLLTVDIYGRRAWLDVTFPIDNDINSLVLVERQGIRDTTNKGHALLDLICAKYRYLCQQPGSQSGDLWDLQSALHRRCNFGRMWSFVGALCFRNTKFGKQCSCSAL